jgi:DmsE family decaheme c-type cytochrome
MAIEQTTMKNQSSLLAVLLFLPVLMLSVVVLAEEPAAPAATPAAPVETPVATPTAPVEAPSTPVAPATPAATPAAPAPVLASQYTEKGADTCLKCHDEESEFPVFSIFKTKHAQPADKRTPFAGLQCEACHGPGAEHAKKVPEGQKQAPIIKFGANSAVPAEKQNKYCLACHQGNARIVWKDSIHERNDLVCASCHKIHAPRDAVLAKTTQADVCYSCHQKARADFYKASAHPVADFYKSAANPVRGGLISCSECHSPHGTNSNTLLVKPTVNQTCYTCHAEKRGPFLWEHAPVAEDCTLCHHPHGSVNQARLKKNPPMLCQQCHSVAGHPSVAYTPAGLPGGGAGGQAFLLAGSCLNCHSQIHGSNHPSGAKLMR